MRIISSILVLAGLVLGQDNANASSPTDTPVGGAKKFILQFTKGSDVAALSKELGSRRGARVLKTFDSHLFSGISIETAADNVDTLSALSSVSQVWPSQLLRLEDPGLKQARTGSGDAGASVYDIHSMTGVDRLHNQGVFGKGAVVAVVDTGVAYDHPALGGGFGPGYKVAGGWDFIGQSTYPFGGDKEPDADPYDLMGHGTHVAGIVAGKGDVMTGVAPEATIMAYKVFGTEDGVWDADIMEGMIKAYEDGADVITVSIQGHGGWGTHAWPALASALVEEGVVVTLCAGNWGEAGPFFHSSGASGDLVLSVGSVDATSFPTASFAANFTLDGKTNETRVAYLWGGTTSRWPDTFVDVPLVPVGLDTTKEDEACDELPPGTPDLANVIAVVRKASTCSMYQQVYYLGLQNATNIMFYLAEGEKVTWPVSPWEGNGGMMEARAGQAIIDTIKAGGNVTATFDGNPLTDWVGMFDEAGGQPSSFSCWGGRYDLQLKPDIMAPGSRILSTVLDGKYDGQEGTSMAAPYVAGVAALYIGKYGGRKVHGKGFAKELAGKIMSSGRAIPVRNTPAWFASTMQAGNGLVDAWKVLNYNTSLSWAKFALNDTHHFSRYQNVEVTNSGSKPVTYTFAVESAAGYEIYTPYDEEHYGTGTFKMAQDLVPAKMVPEVKFPSGKFTVQPGQTKKAEFIFKYPEGLRNVPVYSGKVLIMGDNGESLSVPYMGIASNLKTEMEAQEEPRFPQLWSGENWPYLTLDQHSNFTFNLDMKVKDYPRITTRYKWGVQEVRWDIFEAGWKERQWNTYPPVAEQNGYVGSVAFYADSSNNAEWQFDPSRHNASWVTPFPLIDVIRTSSINFVTQYWWLGQFANGSQIANGKYTMRYAVLKPFGRREASDNWDKVVHEFSVVR